MSYKRGLGQAESTSFTVAPSGEPMRPFNQVVEQTITPQGTSTRETFNGVDFASISSDRDLSAMARKLVDVGVLRPEDAFSSRQMVGGRPQWLVQMNSPLIRALKSYWTRMGADQQLWPNDFVPYNGAYVKIAEPLYELLRRGVFWRTVPVNGRPRVLLDVNDPFVRDRMRRVLVTDGYLDSTAPITFYDGPLLQALQRFWTEAAPTNILDAAEKGQYSVPNGARGNPQGDQSADFSPSILKALAVGDTPRARHRVAAAQFGLIGAVIKPPLYGSPSQQPMLPPQLARVIARLPTARPTVGAPLPLPDAARAGLTLTPGKLT